jgi:hypothetical protein
MTEETYTYVVDRVLNWQIGLDWDAARMALELELQTMFADAANDVSTIRNR